MKNIVFLIKKKKKEKKKKKKEKYLIRHHKHLLLALFTGPTDMWQPVISSFFFNHKKNQKKKIKHPIWGARFNDALSDLNLSVICHFHWIRKTVFIRYKNFKKKKINIRF